MRANSTLRITSGRAEDLDSCLGLWMAALTARDGSAAVSAMVRARAKFDLPRVSWRVLRGPGAVVSGFGLVTLPGTGSPTDPPDAVYLALLAVDPALWGFGHGASLLSVLIADARTSGNRAAVLHVLTDNVSATSLYVAQGWRPHGDPYVHPQSGKPVQTYVLR
jgi:ribosomal protein S18 acetylase RimI-like enzyme